MEPCFLLVACRYAVPAGLRPGGAVLLPSQGSKKRGIRCQKGKRVRELLPLLAVRRYNVLAGLRPGGVVLVNAPWKSIEEVEAHCSARTKARLAELRPQVCGVPPFLHVLLWFGACGG